MAKVYPLIFEPILQPRIWGGRRLQSVLGKRLPEGRPIGESWQVADLEHAQSVVACGPMRGRTLPELVRLWDKDLIGRAELIDGRFPLLIKFLDAQEILSVQVHPDRATAQRLGGSTRIKNEAWYVIDATDDAFIYHGLRENVDAVQLQRALRDGRVEELLRRVPVSKGHCYYLPSGTVHALGGGVLVAEIQTPSDVTYRLYDWDRVDQATGLKRELHIEEALASAAFTSSEAEQRPEHAASLWTSTTSLCRCESFVIERVRMADGVEMEIPYAEMVIWIVLEGRGTISCEGSSTPTSFGVGDTIVLPAGMKKGRVRTAANCMWLEVTVPIESSLAHHERLEREARTSPTRTAARFVPLRVPPSP